MKPTQEQVIAWAREAMGHTSIKPNDKVTFYVSYNNGIDADGFCDSVETFIERLTTLAYEAGRKDENEACAKVCEHFISSKENNDAWMITRDLALQAAADVIRARREQ